MATVSEMRKQMSYHPGLNRYIFRDGKLINPEELGIGDIIEVIEDDADLNALTQVYMKKWDSKDDEDFYMCANDIANIHWKFLYRIQLRTNNNRWVDVPNEEGLQPDQLLEQGILHPGDIIRFLDIQDEVAYVIPTEDEDLVDMNGLFYVGLDYEDYRDSIQEELYEAVNSDDDDEDDEADDTEHEHGIHLVPKIVPGSTIVEFVKTQLNTIKRLGVCIDEIDKEEE